MASSNWHRRRDTKWPQPTSFDQPWEASDILLVVEGKPLYACKPILCANSPVFEAMMLSDFREKHDNEISIADDAYEDFVELMRVIYPPLRRDVIHDGNVDCVVKLADKYQMSGVLDLCEQYLLTQEPSLDRLVTAQVYHLKNLLSHCACSLCVDIGLAECASDDSVATLLTAVTRIELMKSRIGLFEDFFDRCKMDVSFREDNYGRYFDIGSLSQVHEYFRAIICPQANPVGLLGGSYNAPMADGDVGHVAEPSASRKRGGEVGGGDKEPEVAGCEYGQSPDDPPNCASDDGYWPAVHATHKALCTSSPVFRQMLASFDQQQGILDLGQENYKDVVTLMRLIQSPPHHFSQQHPQTYIDGDNVHGITQLAYKYEVGDVLKQCEQYLIDNGQASVDKLVLAQDCHLPHLFEHCLTDASSSLRLSDVIADAKFPSLSEDTVLLLLQKRLALFEMLFEETEICVYYHESIPNGCRCHPHKIRGLAQAHDFFRKEADNVRPRPRTSSASASSPVTSSAPASTDGSPSRRQMIVTTSRQSPGALSLIKRRSDQR